MKKIVVLTFKEQCRLLIINSFWTYYFEKQNRFSFKSLILKITQLRQTIGILSLGGGLHANDVQRFTIVCALIVEGAGKQLFAASSARCRR